MKAKRWPPVEGTKVENIHTKEVHNVAKIDYPDFAPGLAPPVVVLDDGTRWNWGCFVPNWDIVY